MVKMPRHIIRLARKFIPSIYAAIFLIPCSGSCQQEMRDIGGIFDVSFNYKIGFGQVNYNSIKVPNDLNAQDLQFSYLRPLRKGMHVGLGLGIAGYHNPTRNTTPVEAVFRFAPFKDEKAMGIDLDIGYAIALGETFEQGFTASSGFSWHPNIVKNQNFGIEIGYTIQEVRNSELVLVTPGGITRIFDNIIEHLVYVGISYKVW